MAAGVMFCIVVYGLEHTPIKFTDNFMASIESIGHWICILGLAGLFYNRIFHVQFGVDFTYCTPFIVTYLTTQIHYTQE